MLTNQNKIRRKGQMTLPAKVREDLDIEDGDVVYLRKENGTYTLTVGEGWVERTRGALVTNHPPMEPEQLEQIIQEYAESLMIEKYGDSE